MSGLEMQQSNNTTLAGLFWLGVPLAIYSGPYLARATLSAPVYGAWFEHESGIVETGTFAVLVLAAIGGLLATGWAWRRGDHRLTLLFALFTLGCIYFGGEEASWGQHWFGWATHDEWRALNNQAETNLHNSNALAGSLLDQLPRNLLAVAMLIGGAIVPLVRRARGRHYAPGSFRYWIMPGTKCVAIGLIAPLASFPQKIFKATMGQVPYPFDINAGEVKELTFGVFLCLYIAAVLVRIRAHGKPALER
jgi:hypothetical protein